MATYAVLHTVLRQHYDQWTGADDDGGSRSDVLGVSLTAWGWGAGEQDAAGQISDATGGTVQRTWRTVGDAHVRPEHAAADGQTVGLKEPFSVGGESLDYPADYEHGSPGNVLNCRCSLDYSLSLK